MKFKLFLSACLLGCMLLFSSCSKELKGDEVNYIGFWESDYSLMTIMPNGEGSYLSTNGFATKSANGKVRVKKNKLKIGVVGFSIDQAPKKKSNGSWVMKLDGEEFERD